VRVLIAHAALAPSELSEGGVGVVMKGVSLSSLLLCAFSPSEAPGGGVEVSTAHVLRVFFE